MSFLFGISFGVFILFLVFVFLKESLLWGGYSLSCHCACCDSCVWHVECREALPSDLGTCCSCPFMPVAVSSVTSEIVLLAAGTAPLPTQIGPIQAPTNRRLGKETEVCPCIEIQLSSEKNRLLTLTKTASVLLSKRRRTERRHRVGPWSRGE